MVWPGVEPEVSSQAWLEWIGGRRTPIHGSCFFGRARTNSVVLADERVSRRHAMVHAQGESEYWLIDLGSSNGTYLNGRRLVQPSRLADHDRIEIGGHVFLFRNPQRCEGVGTDHTTQKTIQDIKSVNCWLLVADLERSTQLTQKVPETEAPRIMGQWLADCKQVIDDHSGAINKFLGDGFLAYWVHGQDVPPEVAGALRALQDLQAAARFRFRVVLHFGPVYMGGGATLGEENLSGNEVHFVFRMEKVAAVAGTTTLMSEPAHAQIQSLLPSNGSLRHQVPSFEGEYLFHTF